VLKNLIANMALLTAYLFVVTQLFRNRPVDARAPNKRKLLFGALSGGFGIVLMSYSLVLDELTRLDLRYLAVMVAAQYGGLTAALPAGLIVALGRVLFLAALIMRPLPAASALSFSVRSQGWPRNASHRCGRAGRFFYCLFPSFQAQACCIRSECEAWNISRFIWA